jgi:hypothetical protein
MQAKVTVLDAQGRTRSITLNMDATQVTTLALAQSSLDVWLAAFEAASGCSVIKALLSVPLTVPGNAADAGSNIDEGFAITCLMEDGDNHTFEFPAPAKTAGVFDFITNGQVNVSDSQIVDLLAFYNASEVFRVGKYGGGRVVDTVLSGYLTR